MVYAGLICYCLLTYYLSIRKIRQWCREDKARVNDPDYMYRGGDEPTYMPSIAFPVWLVAPIWFPFLLVGRAWEFATHKITGE